MSDSESTTNVIAKPTPPARGMYYTPDRIVDPAAGTGALLPYLVDAIISNPPYVAQNSPRHNSTSVVWYE